MGKLKAALTDEVINNNALHTQLENAHWFNKKVDWLKVGDLLIMPKMLGRSAFLALRTVVDIDADGHIFVQGEETRRSRLMCPERCLVIGRAK